MTSGASAGAIFFLLAELGLRKPPIGCISRDIHGGGQLVYTLTAHYTRRHEYKSGCQNDVYQKMYTTYDYDWSRKDEIYTRGDYFDYQLNILFVIMRK